MPVNSPTHITHENNAKIQPQRDWENAFEGASGGARGIRTLETVTRLHTFQACAFDHSATAPTQCEYTGHWIACKGQLRVAEGFAGPQGFCLGIAGYAEVAVLTDSYPVYREWCKDVSNSAHCAGLVRE